MKIKTANLTGTQLDWLVAKADNNLYPTGDVRLLDGRMFSIEPGSWEQPDRWQQYSPSTNWAQGGPIIERESISEVCAVGDGIWSAYPRDEQLARQIANGSVGPTPLIAAMRCYVSSKLGDEIEIPEELV